MGKAQSIEDADREGEGPRVKRPHLGNENELENAGAAAIAIAACSSRTFPVNTPAPQRRKPTVMTRIQPGPATASPEAKQAADEAKAARKHRALSEQGPGVSNPSLKVDVVQSDLKATPQAVDFALNVLTDCGPLMRRRIADLEAEITHLREFSKRSSIGADEAEVKRLRAGRRQARAEAARLRERTTR
ncbi:uncharacterized protein DSM5745_10478 [Aspergillus mulundensis]|uniref:Uncharacterized protein n=1 Tax=Aspergillus mulundensis TaxID=1810919 RepID=A0A3D8QJ05_9EURO|nr:hypothetical protein DSM5745_10478 [Aspergillus mulundensis]RDW61806.1 hypothetical protein DSM5745_10478 [Aspergillus mulundensis]